MLKKIFVENKFNFSIQKNPSFNSLNLTDLLMKSVLNINKSFIERFNKNNNLNIDLVNSEKEIKERNNHFLTYVVLENLTLFKLIYFTLKEFFDKKKLFESLDFNSQWFEKEDLINFFILILMKSLAFSSIYKILSTDSENFISRQIIIEEPHEWSLCIRFKNDIIFFFNNIS